MELKLKDKTAVVTGGCRGLGKSISLGLAKEGARVVVNYRGSAEKADAVVQEIRKRYGGRAVAVQGDVSCEEDVKKIFRFANECFGPVDILVNNAGVCPRNYVRDMPLSEWELVMRTNVTGVFLMSREMVDRCLSEGRPGKIVNIASQAAYNGSRNGKSAYAASKGAVISFTNSLSKEVAGSGINVNAVAPGMILTEMTEDVLRERAEEYRRTIPVGRVADPGEVVDAVLFLASERAGYISGSVLDVSGGMINR